MRSAALFTTVASVLATVLLSGLRVGAAPKSDDVNRRNPDGSTPLQWAVYEGDVAEVRRLLAAGADV